MSRDPGEMWAAWLRDQFDHHPTITTNADLVRAGGDKPNGRPVIDPSTVTQWLRGRRPSFHLASVAATAFGVPTAEALAAAGYEIDRVDIAWQKEGDVGGGTQDAQEEEDSLLYKRPAGLNDEEWEQIKADTRGYLEWQIEKASRER